MRIIEKTKDAINHEISISSELYYNVGSDHIRMYGILWNEDTIYAIISQTDYRDISSVDVTITVND